VGSKRSLISLDRRGSRRGVSRGDLPLARRFQARRLVLCSNSSKARALAEARPAMDALGVNSVLVCVADAGDGARPRAMRSRNAPRR